MKLGQQLIDLATQARTGDAIAMDGFARLAMVLVKHIARERLHGSRMARWIDASDIAQIVVFQACRRVLDAEHHDTVANWTAMLRRMTANTIADQARRVRRDSLFKLPELSSAAHSPSSIDLLEDRSSLHDQNQDNEDLLAFIQLHIPSRQLAIWQMRRNGCSWTEIGLHVGANPQSLRVRFNAMLRTVATACTREKGSATVFTSDNS